MSFQIPGKEITRIAAADHSANQFKFVVVDSNGRAALAGAGAHVLGVLQNNPASLESATIMIDGVSKVVAGAAITAGANVASNASGLAVTAATGNRIAGIALEAASGANQVIAVALVRGGAA